MFFDNGIIHDARNKYFYLIAVNYNVMMMTLACFSEQIIEYCLSVVISIEELGDIRPFRAGDCPVVV